MEKKDFLNLAIFAFLLIIFFYHVVVQQKNSHLDFLRFTKNYSQKLNYQKRRFGILKDASGLTQTRWIKEIEMEIQKNTQK